MSGILRRQELIPKILSIACKNRFSLFSITSALISSHQKKAIAYGMAIASISKLRLESSVNQEVEDCYRQPKRHPVSHTQDLQYCWYQALLNIILHNSLEYSAFLQQKSGYQNQVGRE